MNVTIHSINNPGGFEQGRSCCDGSITVCRGAPTCDTQIEACVTTAPINRDTCYNSPLASRFKSHVYDNQNSVFVPKGDVYEPGNYIDNPMEIKFDRWKVSTRPFIDMKLIMHNLSPHKGRERKYQKI